MSDKIGHQNLILWTQASPVTSILRSLDISFCNFTTAGEVLQSFRILLTFYFFAQRCCLQTVVFTFTPLFVFLRTFTDFYRPTQTKWGAKRDKQNLTKLFLASSPQMVSPGWCPHSPHPAINTTRRETALFLYFHFQNWVHFFKAHESFKGTEMENQVYGYQGINSSNWNTRISSIKKHIYRTLLISQL